MNRLRQTFLSLLLLIGATIALALPGVAGADQIQLNYTGTVVNSAGVPQPEVEVYDLTLSTEIGTTDFNGKIPVSLGALCTRQGEDPGLLDWPPCQGPAAGDVLTFSRSDEESTDPCTTAPEGWPGVSNYDTVRVTQSPADPYGFRVSLPAVPGTAYDPTISNEESGMVGAINQKRIEDGLTPLTISSVLSASADKYLSNLPARPLDYNADATYCMASGPGIRALDAGFPTKTSIDESVLQNDGNAFAALSDLEKDPHQDALDDSSATLIGIAQEGGTWVIDTSELPANDPAYSRAGDTRSTGDYGLVASEFAVPQPVAPSKPPKTAGLKIAKIRVKGHKIGFVGTLQAGAKGSVKVVVKSVKTKKGRALKTARSGAKVTATGTVKKAGSYVLIFSFTGKSGTLWQSATVKHKIRVH